MRPRIHQLALRHLKNREDAEEVTQDVLLKVYRKIGAFRGDSALSSWIYRIVQPAVPLAPAPWRARHDQERDRALAALEASDDGAPGRQRIRRIGLICPTRNSYASNCAGR